MTKAQYINGPEKIKRKDDKMLTEFVDEQKSNASENNLKKRD